MQQLEEKPLAGLWRSFKMFKSSGQSKLLTREDHTELSFGEERRLTVKIYQKNEPPDKKETTKWSLSFKNKKHFLHIPDHKLNYEIITINHTVMVLLDVSSFNKIFFAKNEHWEGYLQSNTTIVF